MYMEEGWDMTYRYLLFDLDGTLTDPKEGITKSVQHSLRSFGIMADDLKDFERFIGPPLRDSFKEFYGFSEEKAAEAIMKYREYFSDKGIHENVIYEGMAEMLEELKAVGKKLAIATSKPEVYAKQIAVEIGIAGCFEVITGSELGGRRTDKGEVIAETLKRFGIPRGETSGILMVGDRKHDIFGGRKLGLDTLGVRYGYAREQELEEAGATYVLNTVGELRDFLIRH